jgi:hypothetical protein
MKWQVVDEDQEEYGSEHASLGDSADNGCWVGRFSINNYALSAACEKCLNPLQGMVSDAIMMKLG